MTIIPQKRCSKCFEYKPATTEYFRKASKEKSGLTARCKVCLHQDDALYREKNPEHGKQWYEDNKDRINAQRKAEYESSPEKYRKLGRDYYAEHSEHIRELSMIRYYAHPEKAKKQRDKQYAKRRNDPELWAAELLRLADYKKQHPERRRKVTRKSYEKHKDKKREYGREYEKRFPEKIRAKTHKRIALRKAAEGSYTAEDLQRIYAENEGRCAYCGMSIYWHIKRDIHVDHIKPLSKGGSNWPDNLTLTCHACNESKGDKLLTDWLLVRGW